MQRCPQRRRKKKCKCGNNNNRVTTTIAVRVVTTTTARPIVTATIVESVGTATKLDISSASMYRTLKNFDVQLCCTSERTKKKLFQYCIPLSMLSVAEIHQRTLVSFAHCYCVVNMSIVSARQVSLVVFIVWFMLVVSCAAVS